MIFGLWDSTFYFLVCCTTDLEVEDTFNYYIFYHLYVTIISTLAWEQFWKKSCLSWPHFNTQQRSTYKNPLNSWLMTWCVQNHFMLCLVLIFSFLKKSLKATRCLNLDSTLAQKYDIKVLTFSKHCDAETS